MVSRGETASMRSTRSGPEALDDLGAHERRDVLGRLQTAIVRELDQVPADEGRIGGEQQGDVDVTGWRAPGA